MLRASVKDIFRTIKKEKKRFFSIMFITILGVTMMTGLQAGCEDLRFSADKFYDQQKLFDISIMSTLGLTEEDVKVIGEIPGVVRAEGTYTEVVHTKRGNINKTAEIKIVREGGLNIPYLTEGKLPEKADEIVVTSSYLTDTGKKIGDLLTIKEIFENKEAEAEEKNEIVETSDDEEDIFDKEFEIEEEEEQEEPNFPVTEFKITGVIIDVMDINNADGSAAFRATPNADYTFFVTPEAIKADAYSAVYLSLTDSEKLLCYGTEYNQKIESFVNKIEEDIMEQREQARYKEITGEAYEKIEEKEKEMEDAFLEAEEKLAEAEIEIDDGWAKLADGKRELEEKEKEVYQEIEDGKKELADAYEQLNEGWLALNDAEKQLNLEEAKLEDGKETLAKKEEEVRLQLAEGETQLIARREENEKNHNEMTKAVTGIKKSLEAAGGSWNETLDEAWKAYIKATKIIIYERLSPLMAAGESDPVKLEQETSQAVQEALQKDPAYGKLIQNLSVELGSNLVLMGMIQSGQLPGIADINGMIELATARAGVAATSMILEEAFQGFEEQKQYALSQLEAAWEQLREGERMLEEGRNELSRGRDEVIENYKKYEEGVAELVENEEKAKKEFQDARQELEEGRLDLVEGETTLQENREEYLDKKSEAEEKIAKARQEVAKIDMTKWYVQDRTSLSGYSNVDSDTLAIESLAGVFAVVFFIVAILISLTTVTRMVEEERGLIGTYKALGFRNDEIGKKYLTYTMMASGIGSVLGCVGGFVVLPEILFVFFKVMYLFPEYSLHFNKASGAISGSLFIAGIVGAALMACYSELKHLPAYLMRPKAPKAGTRVFLEWITPLWKRLSFLNKVTARNLFRYKKRMFMTLFGIAGCTALLVLGLAIKDSVSELMPLQYENVYRYDLLSVTSAEENEKLLSYMDESKEITSYINLQIESVKIKNKNDDTEKVQLMIFENPSDFKDFLCLTDSNNEDISQLEEGIYLTENAATMLSLKTGDMAALQRLDLTQKEAKVNRLVKNYLGNSIYMSKETYEELFGTYYEPNGILANLSEECEDHIAYSDNLAKEDWILSSISTKELEDGFSAAFTLINLVVYVVLILAAGLAFVVLFTLASINISERERELATIKVLGFFDKEVHSYVNKETLILTSMGILIGLPVGATISSMLTEVLKMPSIYFEVTIYTQSYLISSAIALIFALIVQFLTNKSLNVIDPVEALKSVE